VYAYKPIAAIVYTFTKLRDNVRKYGDNDEIQC